MRKTRSLRAGAAGQSRAGDRQYRWLDDDDDLREHGMENPGYRSC